MAGEIATREQAMVAPGAMTEEQVDLVKRTITPGATDDELKLFIHQCTRTGLDPFAKQIYSIKRKSKDEQGNWVETRQTQISIDGARLIAERQNARRPGSYRPGPVEWMNEEGRWLPAWTVGGHPAAARATIYKDGAAVAAVAAYNEFVQTTSGGSPTRQWKAMPAHMLAKCAEMLALRRAFPQELSGLVIEEEPPLAAPKQVTTTMEEPKASKKQVEALNEALDALVLSDTSRDKLDARLLELYGTADTEQLTPAQADEVLEKLSKGEDGDEVQNPE